MFQMLEEIIRGNGSFVDDIHDPDDNCVLSIVPAKEAFQGIITSK